MSKAARPGQITRLPGVTSRSRDGAAGAAVQSSYCNSRRRNSRRVHVMMRQAKAAVYPQVTAGTTPGGHRRSLRLQGGSPPRRQACVDRSGAALPAQHGCWCRRQRRGLRLRVLRRPAVSAGGFRSERRHDSRSPGPRADHTDSPAHLIRSRDAEVGRESLVTRPTPNFPRLFRALRIARSALRVRAFDLRSPRRMRRDFFLQLTKNVNGSAASAAAKRFTMEAHGKAKVALTFALYQGESLVRRDTIVQDIVKVGKGSRGVICASTTRLGVANARGHRGRVSRATSRSSTWATESPGRS